MSEQPEALRLADALEADRWHISGVTAQHSADLLREQHAEIQRLREALNEMLDESMDGIAICPLTKIKARNALGRKP